jgi:hypothetical protein
MQVGRPNYLVPEEILVRDILEGPREYEVDELVVVLPLLLPRSTFLAHLRDPAEPSTGALFQRDRSLLATVPCVYMQSYSSV